MTKTTSLYERLGGYDAIAAVADKLLPRLMGDELLARFWQHRGDDGLAREKQLLIDILCASAGGPMFYTRSRHGDIAPRHGDFVGGLGCVPRSSERHAGRV